MTTLDLPADISYPPTNACGNPVHGLLAWYRDPPAEPEDSLAAAYKDGKTTGGTRAQKSSTWAVRQRNY